MNEFPHQSGDYTVIGPECFTDADAQVISYKGSNYARVPDNTTIVRLVEPGTLQRLRENHEMFERECPPIAAED